MLAPMTVPGPDIPLSRRLVDDSFASSFWVLADAEGNEVCVCTWTGRDDRD